MSDQCQFRVRYWGATGTFPSALHPDQVQDKVVRAVEHLIRQGALAEYAQRPPENEALRRIIEQCVPFCLRSTFGGNTSCVEVETPDALIIIDAGSGLRQLGMDLTRRWNAPDYRGDREAHVLLTHAHMDHTYATPFFDPYYDDRNHFEFWAPQLVLDSLNAVLSPESALRSIYFPPTFEQMAGLREFHAVEAGETFQIRGTRVSTHALDHPGGCVAYRLERDRKRIVFASDHEHRSAPDRGLAEFARNADLLYADAQYLLDEYLGKRGIAGEAAHSKAGWGHSAVEWVVQTGILAGARLLHLGHHEPKRTDHELADIERYARELARDALASKGEDPGRCQVQLAREGMTVSV